MRLAADHHRDDDDVPLQRRGNLFANVIAFAALRVGGQQFHPPRPDDGDQHVALGERLVEFAIETLPGQKPVDVHEDVRFAKAAAEPVADTAGISRRIFATVADEYFSLRAQDYE